MDPRSYKTADTLLDFYAGFSASDVLPDQEAAFNTSMQRLSEIDAVLATDIDGELFLDFTPVLLASSVTYQWLFAKLSDVTGRSTEELTFELRGFITQLADDA